MRKLVLVASLSLLVLPFAACNSTNNSMSVDDIARLDSDFESEVRTRERERRTAGRANAFGRSLTRITNFVDKYFWNYDVNDPYVNHPTRVGTLRHTGRFLVDTVTAVPFVDQIPGVNNL